MMYLKNSAITAACNSINKQDGSTDSSLGLTATSSQRQGTLPPPTVLDENYNYYYEYYLYYYVVDKIFKSHT